LELTFYQDKVLFCTRFNVV